MEQPVVLLVDEDLRILHLLQKEFLEKNWRVKVANTQEKALSLFKHHRINVVIMEICFKEQIDFSLLKQMKGISNQIPIVLLSREHSDNIRVQSFLHSGDDFIAKPFNKQEVFLRSARLIQLYHQLPVISKKKTMCMGCLTIDKEKKEIYVHKKQVILTKKEYQLLLFLVEHSNVVCSRQLLLKEVWQYTYLGEERSVDTHIRRLRKKLMHYSSEAADMIQTVRGQGYCFLYNNKNK